MTIGYDKELAKLERIQAELRERQVQDLQDKYSSDETRIDVNDYETVVNAGNDYAPKGGVSWKDYWTEAKIYAKVNQKKNYQTHVENSKKVWYTHRNPMGCFMCNDSELIAILVRVIGLMASKYPDLKF